MKLGWGIRSSRNNYRGKIGLWMHPEKERNTQEPGLVGPSRRNFNARGKIVVEVPK